MIIDWDNLSKGNKLDYFAITVANGEILKTQPYYIVENQNIFDLGNFVWNCLLSQGFLKCFSYGKSGQNCEKFDFLIMSNDRECIYRKLAKEFLYFDCFLIDKFKNFLNHYSLDFINHIIGCRKKSDKQNMGFENICLYFSTGRYFPYANAKYLINSLINEFSFKKNMIFPEMGTGSHLHMVALDFAKNEFKLKFYFKFNRDYDFKRISEYLKNTTNSNVVSNIVYSNGRIDIFQVAMSASNIKYYNFYFRQN